MDKCGDVNSITVTTNHWSVPSEARAFDGWIEGRPTKQQKLEVLEAAKIARAKWKPRDEGFQLVEQLKCFVGSRIQVQFWDPIMYMLTYGATYVGQAFAGNVKLASQLIKEGMEHKGFAFVNLLSQCPSFNDIDTAQAFKEACEEVPEGHDTSDLNAAMNAVNAAKKAGRIPTGLLYKTDRPTLDQRMAELVERVGGHKDYDLRKIIDLARP